MQSSKMLERLEPFLSQEDISNIKKQFESKNSYSFFSIRTTKERATSLYKVGLDYQIIPPSIWASCIAFLQDNEKEKILFLQKELDMLEAEFKENDSKYYEETLFHLLENYIKKNQLDMLRVILKKQPSLSLHHYIEGTIWHSIARDGTPEIADLFLASYQAEAKNDINPFLQAESDGLIAPGSPIFSAIEKKNIKMYRYLRIAGAKISSPVEKQFGDTLLHHLVKHNVYVNRNTAEANAALLEILHDITSTNPAITDTKNKEELTPLGLAIMLGNYLLSRCLTLSDFSTCSTFYPTNAKSIPEIVLALSVNHKPSNDHFRAVQAAAILLVLSPKRPLYEQLKESDSKEVETMLLKSLPMMIDKQYGYYQEAHAKENFSALITQWDLDVCILVSNFIVDLLKNKFDLALRDIALPCIYTRMNTLYTQQLDNSLEKKSSNFELHLQEKIKILRIAILAGNEQNIKRICHEFKEYPHLLAQHANYFLKNIELNWNSVATAGKNGMLFFVTEMKDFISDNTIFYKILRYLRSLPKNLLIELALKALETSNNTDGFSKELREYINKNLNQLIRTDQNVVRSFAKNLILQVTLSGNQQSFGSLMTILISHFPEISLAEKVTDAIVEAKLEPKNDLIPFLLQFSKLTPALLKQFPEAVNSEMSQRHSQFEIKDSALKNSMKTFTLDSKQLGIIKNELSSYNQSQRSDAKNVDMKIDTHNSALIKLWQACKLSNLHQSESAAKFIAAFRILINVLRDNNPKNSICHILAFIELANGEKKGSTLIPELLALLSLPPTTKNPSEGFLTVLPDIIKSLPIECGKFWQFIQSHEKEKKLFDSIGETLKIESKPLPKGFGMWQPAPAESPSERCSPGDSKLQR